MPHSELLSQIQNLSRLEKFEIIAILATELAKEEKNNLSNSESYLAQLRNSHEAANSLMELLAEKQPIENA